MKAPEELAEKIERWLTSADKIASTGFSHQKVRLCESMGFDWHETIAALQKALPRTVKFSQLGSLPIGVVVRNNEGGTIAVRESERDWFIPGLDYEIELWELENPEGDDFTILFTPNAEAL